MPMDTLNSEQLIVVANRLPLEPIYADEDQNSSPMSWRLAPGGLVSALESILRTRPSIWVGAGDEVPEMDLGEMQLEAVSLDPQDAHGYYEGFSNTAIWPLYHSSVVTPEFHRNHFTAYQRVNQAFADRVISIAEVGATVWVHDYQLQLLPQLLRERRPDLVIGFFLHIPFPPSELFAQLPWRHSILQGLLGADLIGFQTHGDATNFRDSTQRLLGPNIDVGRVILSDRHAEIGVFPVGIDAAGFAEIAADPAVRARAVALRAELGDPKTLLLGVDRLDYTKGIDIRLKAFAEVLESGQLDPTETVFVQVAVPSREELSEYQNIRDEIELLVGRFNGSLSSLGATPIHYLRRGLEREELVALYLAADVMLVTPLRDGMNLVCKEYVASRNDNSGALILSEFTGAAAQLTDAWLVNPFDTLGLEEAICEVVLTDDEVRRNRMHRMRKVVFNSDSSAWANDFLGTLHSIAVGADEAPEPKLVNLNESFLNLLAATPHLLVCCDYDGTLAPIVNDPSQARPLKDAVVALRGLSLLPSTTVAVVSGRALSDVKALARLPSEVQLVGSHGAEIDHEFTPNLQQRRLLDQCVAASTELSADVGGAHIEIKPGSVAIHVRRCTPTDGKDLIERIVMGPGQFPGIVVQHGKKVIELSVMQTQKSDAVAAIRHRVGASMTLFIGDDVTDESVFTSLSDPDVGVKVGDGSTAAPWRVNAPQDVADLLFELSSQRERWLHGENGLSDQLGEDH
jgi:trehalose 6-phosphate synthase/phosphatase